MWGAKSLCSLSVIVKGGCTRTLNWVSCPEGLWWYPCSPCADLSENDTFPLVRHSKTLWTIHFPPFLPVFSPRAWLSTISFIWTHFSHLLGLLFDIIHLTNLMTSLTECWSVMFLDCYTPEHRQRLAYRWFFSKPNCFLRVTSSFTVGHYKSPDSPEVQQWQWDKAAFKLI